MNQPSDFDRQRQLLWAVRAEIASDPEFLSPLVGAMQQGQKDALAEANKRAADADRAWLLALCILNGHKLTPSMKEMMERALIPVLSRPGAKCQAENEGLKRLQAKYDQP